MSDVEKLLLSDDDPDSDRTGRKTMSQTEYNTTEGILLTPAEATRAGTLALVLGVMADGFVVALMPPLGIRIATSWNITVITVLAVMPL